MQWWEAQRFINGFRKRQRTAWITTRHLEYMLVRMFGKPETAPNCPEDLYPFAWEKQNRKISDEEYAEAMALIEEENSKNHR